MFPYYSPAQQNYVRTYCGNVVVGRSFNIMSYGQTDNPCDNFKHWFGNNNLCGNCAWERTEHPTLPIIKEVVFALIFDGKIVGYKKWLEGGTNWLYSETWRADSLWSYDIKIAYSNIELAKLWVA